MNNYIIASNERQAALEAAKAAFFMGGRQVTELPSRQVLPPSRKNWVDPETVLTRKRVAPRPRKTSQEDLATQAKERARADLVARIRTLAATMTLAEVQRETGLGSFALRNMARSDGFEFQPYDPTQNLKPNSADRTMDALNVIRIKDARDRGLSRHAAQVDLDISYSLMKRLLAEYGIEYPTQMPGRK